MSRICCATILLVTLVGTCGCQWAAPVGEVLMVPYDLTLGQIFRSEEPSDADRPVIESAMAHRIGYNPPRWSRDLALGPKDRVVHATLLGDVIVCIERPSNMVSAVSVRDGGLVWQKHPAKPTLRLFEPVRLKDEILINSETHIYYLAANDGRLVGMGALEATVADRPVLVDRFAIFGGLNGRVFAHSTATNRSAWSQQMSAGVTARPVTAGLDVFVTDSKGVYGMFESIEGGNKWKGQTYGQISATPAVSSDRVFVACEDQAMYALDRISGREAWRYRAGKPLKAAPIVIGNVVFLPDPDKGLVALDAATGEPLWTNDTTGSPVKTFKGRLLLNDGSSLIAVDPESGKTVVQVPVKPLRTVLLGPADSLILVSEKGQLTRLDVQR